MQTFLEILKSFIIHFSLHPPDSRWLLSILANQCIVRHFIMIPIHGKGHAGKADSQSQHADDGLGAVFPQIADSDFQVMYDYGFIPF